MPSGPKSLPPKSKWSSPGGKPASAKARTPSWSGLEAGPPPRSLEAKFNGDLVEHSTACHADFCEGVHWCEESFELAKVVCEGDREDAVGDLTSDHAHPLLLRVRGGNMS